MLFCKVECLHLSSSKLRCGRSCLAFCFVLLIEFYNVLFQMGFCHAIVIGSDIFQFSHAIHVVCSSPRSFTHFVITSLIIFAEHSILLCYKIFLLKFRWRVSNLAYCTCTLCPQFCLSLFNFVGAVNHF